MRTYDQTVPGRTYKLLIWVYDLWFIVQGDGTLSGRMVTSPQEVHACNVLADDVELDVDERAGVDVVEIGVLEGVGDDAHLESVLGGVTHGETDTIDSDAALIDGEIATTCHVSVEGVTEGVLVAALLVFHGNALRSLIDMSLHDVAIQSAVHLHGTLYVDFIAHTELTQVAALQRLAHGRHGILSVPDAHHGEAHAVVRHALVDGEFIAKGAFQCKMLVVFICFDGDHGGHRLYNAGKHVGDFIRYEV